MQDKYKTYSTIQLAGEEPFIRWILYGEKDSEWSQWISNDTSSKDRINEARQIVLSLFNTSAHTLHESEKKELWNRIGSSIQSKQTATKHTVALWKWGIAAAAAIALLVWFNSTNSSEQILAQTGEQKEISLPDESDVILNAGSSIKFKDKSFSKDRILNLDGEAFFEVNPGSTFTIQTANGTVTVLGTSFNVISRQDRFEVSCYTGSVRVETTDQSPLTIGAGEKSIQSADNKQLNRTTFTPTGNTPGWTNGKFTFEDQPLNVVTGELERQYGVKVHLEPGLDSLRYTGLFESGDLDKAVYLITWPLHLKAAVKGKTITISR